MLFSLVGTIFRALKGWVARVCPDVLGGYCPGKMGGKRPFAAGTIKVCYADKVCFRCACTNVSFGMVTCYSSTKRSSTRED